MPKNIVLCCDGTGNEVEANLSNVLKLFRVVRKNEDQIVFYDPGLGTISSSDPWSRLKSEALGVWGLLTGYGLDENVLDAYRFLVETYAAVDHIYLFGFSRGAYTVRVLAGFLRLVGLLSRDQQNLAGYALTAYKRAAEKNDFEMAWRFERIVSTRRVPIKFVGVWDTVSSVIVPRPDRLYLPSLQLLPYTRTNSYVEIFRQAIAIDERRRMFRINRWGEPQDYKPNPFDPAEPTPQDIKQVWFAGVHGDIGGGYPETQSAHMRTFNGPPASTESATERTFNQMLVLPRQIGHERRDFGIRQARVVLDPAHLGEGRQKVIEMTGPARRIFARPIATRRCPTTTCGSLPILV